MNVQDVVDALTLPGSDPDRTVDGLLTGDAGNEVTGIVVCYMPTLSVIDRAADLGANLIVAHEGLFYAHRTEDEAVETDGPVRLEKKRRIEARGMAIFRCHDYWHRVEPDGVTEGLVQALGWGPYVSKRLPEATIVRLPPTTLAEIAGTAKRLLGLASIRAMGDPSTACAKVGVLAGYRGGGRTAIPLFERESLDLVLYGEGPEWETPEYVRDVLHAGGRKALLVLGHGESEEPGMAALARRLTDLFSGTPIYYVKEKPLFSAL